MSRNTDCAARSLVASIGLNGQDEERARKPVPLPELARNVVSVWYRIPDSRQWSSGLRLSTDGPVNSGRIQPGPADYRVRIRVQTGADTGSRRQSSNRLLSLWPKAWRRRRHTPDWRPDPELSDLRPRDVKYPLRPGAAWAVHNPHLRHASCRTRGACSWHGPAAARHRATEVPARARWRCAARAGRRVWKGGVFCRSRFMCVPKQAERHKFSVPHRQPTSRPAATRMATPARAAMLAPAAPAGRVKSQLVV